MIGSQSSESLEKQGLKEEEGEPRKSKKGVERDSKDVTGKKGLQGEKQVCTHMPFSPGTDFIYEHGNTYSKHIMTHTLPASH